MYSGHSAIMGKKKNKWQDTDYVLKLFNSRLSLARRRYREYQWGKGRILLVEGLSEVPGDGMH